MKPAMGFHVAEYIQDEMTARGWSASDVARKMGGTTMREIAIDQLTLDMLLAAREPNWKMDERTAAKLGQAFGVDWRFLVRLDAAWRESL